MKRHLPSFLAGMFTMLLLGTITVSAIAISGHMTIEVDPINVQVNGAVFQPKDANGNEVPVFVYNGTTYAPLRALAETYGLEVGYDAENNMATVVDPDAKPVDTPTPDTTAKLDYSDWSAEEEAAYQEFKGMWTIEDRSDFDGLDYEECNRIAWYNGDKSIVELKSLLSMYGETKLDRFTIRLAMEDLNGGKGMFALRYRNSQGETSPSLFSFNILLDEPIKIVDQIFHNGLM